MSESNGRGATAQEVAGASVPRGIDTRNAAAPDASGPGENEGSAARVAHRPVKEASPTNSDVGATRGATAEPLDLAAIRSRAEGASAGPWDIPKDSYDVTVGATVLGPQIWQGCGHRIAWVERGHSLSQQVRHDAEFIAHAREDVPALIAEVERLRAALSGSPAEQPVEETPEQRHDRIFHPDF